MKPTGLGGTNSKMRPIETIKADLRAAIDAEIAKSALELDGPRCKCKVNAAKAPHSCPYAEEIKGNDDPEYCTCCDDCRYECCMDI